MSTVGDILGQGWRYHQAGNLEQAEQFYRRALQAYPENADGWYLCGVVCQMTGRLDEAISCYRESLRLRPQFGEVQNNLGVALAVQGRFSEAVPCYQEAIRLKPDYPDAYSNMGVSLTELGRLDEAIASLNEAVRLRQNYPEGWYNLGNALQKRDRFQEAVAAYERALQLNPGYTEVFNNLGAALTRLGDHERAVAWLQHARMHRPQDDSVLLNLGNAYKEQGKISEALTCYRQALDLCPESAVNRSNYLVCLNYDPRATPQELFAEHCRWDDVHGHPPDTGPRPGHDRTPDRPLRVGYVSPDYYHHAAARFIEPILANHDSSRVQSFCYAEVGAPDEVTAHLRALAHNWRSTFGLTDAQMLDLIRGDAIDILVDLAGHTANGRLLVFAHKPAPIQITYLGYPNTTGLRAMDYRLTDAVADPPGEPVCHSEDLIRLPACFCSYAPPEQAPPVTPLPALANGRVTFGSLQNLGKLNAAVLDLWCSVLRAIPTSRLFLFRHNLKGETQSYFRGEFNRRGIAADRVRMEYDSAPYGGYLGVYRDVDIALDPFPWSGHTSACESLWLGVPVLTLYGNRHAGRMAASVLHQLGLDEWVAPTPEGYVERAQRMAGDVDTLGRLRGRLRGLMREAPLCDGKRFTAELEQTYRRLWHRWSSRE